MKANEQIQQCNFQAVVEIQPHRRHLHFHALIHVIHNSYLWFHYKIADIFQVCFAETLKLMNVS